MSKMYITCKKNAHTHDNTLVRCTRTAKNDSSKLHDRECFDIFVLFDSFFFGDGQTAVSAPWFLSLNAGRKRQIV